MITLVIKSTENPKHGAGPSVQFNSDKCVRGGNRGRYLLQHDGPITVGQALSRQELLTTINAHAPEVGKALGITRTNDWPVVLGSPSDIPALLDRLFVYAFSVEQAKRFFRNEPLLPQIITHRYAKSLDGGYQGNQWAQ